MANWLDDVIASGASGVNSVWLKRAADAGLIKPGMSPDEIYRAAASMAAPAPTRQLQLPLGSDTAGDSVRSLIPYDNGARGFQMGANTTRTPATVPSPGTAMVPAPPRGITGPEPKRIGTTAGVPVDRNPGDDVNMFGMSEGSLDEPFDDLARQFGRGQPAGRLTMAPRQGLPAPAQRALPAPTSTAMRDQQAVDGIAGQFDNVMGGRSRTAAPQLAPSKGGMPAWAKAAAGAGLIGAGATAYNMMPSGVRSKESEAVGELDSTDGTADLAAESRPAPKVEATPVSPRDQAQALIAKLNKMRRDAGGEVPEAQQMMQEINRLMALSNQSRNAMTPQQAQGSKDPHIQAQALIAQLNQMRQKAGGEVPQAQQIMAEVRRLQALGDQQRNYAQTR
jgi:hypothetical protein